MHYRKKAFTQERLIGAVGDTSYENRISVGCKGLNCALKAFAASCQVNSEKKDFFCKLVSNRSNHIDFPMVNSVFLLLKWIFFFFF